MYFVSKKSKFMNHTKQTCLRISLNINLYVVTTKFGMLKRQKTNPCTTAKCNRVFLRIFKQQLVPRNLPSYLPLYGYVIFRLTDWSFFGHCTLLEPLKWLVVSDGIFFAILGTQVNSFTDKSWSWSDVFGFNFWVCVEMLIGSCMMQNLYHTGTDNLQTELWEMKRCTMWNVINPSLALNLKRHVTNRDSNYQPQN